MFIPRCSLGSFTAFVLSAAFAALPAIAQTAGGSATLAIQSFSSTEVQTKWALPSTPIDRLELQRAVNSGPFQAIDTWVAMSTYPTSNIDHNCDPNVTYSYRLVGFQSGTTAYTSNAVTITVLGPATLSVTRVTTNEIDLGTTHGDVTGVIETSLDGITFQRYTTVNYSNPSMYALQPGQHYYLRLGVGRQAPYVYSNVVDATTLPNSTPTLQVTPPAGPSSSATWTFSGRATTGKGVIPVLVSGPEGTTPGQFIPGEADNNGNWTRTVTINSPAGRYVWRADAFYTGEQSTPVTVDLSGSSIPPQSPPPVTITSVYAPPPGVYGRFGLSLNLTFSEPVTVTGSPSVSYSIGGVAHEGNASYANQTKFVGFALNAQPGENGPLTIGSTISLNGGTITSASGSPVQLTFTPPSTDGVIVDTTAPAAPVVTSADQNSTPSFAGTADPGSVISVNSPVYGSIASAVAFPNGVWKATWYLQPLAAGTYTFQVTARDTASNLSPATPVTITVPSGSTGTPPSSPVVENVTINGRVGTTISPVLVPVWNSPRGYSAPALANYGLTISGGSGLIEGTPTRTASGVPLALTVINNAGATFATITLNISGESSTTTKADQTITFSSPVSAIIVGQPTTLGATSSAGLPITYTVVSGNATISGNVLTPTSTATLVVRASSAGNDAYNAATTDVNFGAPQKGAQQIATNVKSPDVSAEIPIALAATSTSGLPITYSVVSGPATISGNTLTFTGTGNVTVRVSQPGDANYTAADTTFTFNAHPIARLINISSSVHVAGPNDTAIVGFVVVGSAPKTMLVRAVGDSLVSYGITDPLTNPRLTLFDTNRIALATNSGWANDPQIAAASKTAGAFPLVAGKTDAALVATLAPGLYTAHVTAPNAGTVLFEVYDLGAYDAVPTKQLINVSTSGHVDAGTSLVQGFVIAGDQPKRVLIRAVGAGLVPFGVTNAISDAALKVYSAQTVIAQNDNWETPQPLTPAQSVGNAVEIGAANTAVGAFPLTPGSKDAAVVLTLSPGAYSIVVNGSATQNGTVLLEAYEVP